jgi:DNA-binding HxlR family transcriptional regulator
VNSHSLGLAWSAVGDRWNVLILREAFRGARRFQDWGAALGVSDPVLASRLRDLTSLGLLDRRPLGGAPGRPEYRLTARSRDMWQVLVAIWLWDLRWSQPTAADPLYPRWRLRHDGCGFTTIPLLSCARCGARGVTPFETSVRRRPGYAHAETRPPPAYRRAQGGTGQPDSAELRAVDLLGDRWSTSVLAAAFLGARRFQDFARDIGTISPLLLTDRLNRFVEQNVMTRRPVAEGKRRLEYHLTAKGMDFFGIFGNQIVWASRAFGDQGGPPLTIDHLPCRQELDPVYVCNACNEVLVLWAVRFEDPPLDPRRSA